MSSNLFLVDLQTNIRGEVLTDSVNLAAYSTDASMYQIKPLVVVVPLDEEDVIKAVSIARDHQIPVIARGGGTGLAGQAIGTGMILDFSRHLRKILDFDIEEKWALVQPGVIRDELNQFFANDRLHFAPDPATSSRANIGGMIANNSSGTKSILYGKTLDHVLELKVLLMDGTILQCSPKTWSDLQALYQQEDREGKIYRRLEEIITANRENIQARFPKVMRRVGGYNLDEFLGEDWNLSRLIVGSEGTLALILQAKINLVPLPRYKYACLNHFDSMNAAIRAVPSIVRYLPAAVEIIDKTVIDLSRQNIALRDSCRVIQGNPAAVLVTEFHGETPEEARTKAEKLVADLEAARVGFAHPIFPEGKEYNDILNVRKKGLGLMIGMKSQRKPVAFIEDAAIPLEHLPDYIVEVDAICAKYGVDAVKYAHASVGVIHIRPVLNLREPDDIAILKQIAEETFQLVKKYGGSWSGEHGDGLVRSPFNERFFGPELYQAFRDIKKLFDPHGLLNPGKIVDAPPMDQNLRYGPGYRDQKIETLFHYREAGSFFDEVHMCSGVGECRKTGKGTMCPSYMATLEEEHSTRGRANLLRLAMSGQLGADGLHATELYEVLDLCLSCKACKSECPSNVDMSKLKSEVWQMKYDHQGISLRDRFIRDSINYARIFSGSLAPLVNWIQETPGFRLLLQGLARIDRRRTLPSYSRIPFSAWFRKHYLPPRQSVDKVILFTDTYLNYHESQVGISVIKLLTAMNVEVVLAEIGCCQRPRISNGFLRLAKKEGEKLIEKFRPFLNLDYPILVCEPSCASALQYDLPDLIDHPVEANKVAARIQTVADYIASRPSLNTDHLSLKSNQVYIHGHCHEKALYSTRSIKNIIASSGANVVEIDSGCCGMAGAFGYEKEHYEISEKIGRDRLFNQIQKIPKEALIVADGFSCRHQIEHFTDRKALFWTQVFI